MRRVELHVHTTTAEPTNNNEFPSTLPTELKKFQVVRDVNVWISDTVYKLLLVRVPTFALDLVKTPTTA